MVYLCSCFGLGTYLRTCSTNKRKFVVVGKKHQETKGKTMTTRIPRNDLSTLYQIYLYHGLFGLMASLTVQQSVLRVAFVRKKHISIVQYMCYFGQQQIETEHCQRTYVFFLSRIGNQCFYVTYQHELCFYRREQVTKQTLPC